MECIEESKRRDGNQALTSLHGVCTLLVSGVAINIRDASRLETCRTLSAIANESKNLNQAVLAYLRRNKTRHHTWNGSCAAFRYRAHT